MEKSRVCMSRTINLAKQKCPRKTKLIAYETTPEKSKPNCFVRTGRPPLYKPEVKKIRICTGAQLKKICKPPPCPTPPQKSNLTLGAMLGFFIKSLFVASLIYYTCEAGMWGDSDQAESFYTNLCYLVGGSQKKQYILMDPCETEMEFREQPPEQEDKCKRPPLDRAKMMYKMKECWNHAVTSVFQGLVGFPENLIDTLSKAKHEPKCKKN